MFGRITPVVRNLLILNVLLLVLEKFLNLDLSHLFGLHSVLGDSFKPYQLVTYMFLHGGWFHLLSNMFALFIFGPLLEQFWHQALPDLLLCHGHWGGCPMVCH